MKLAITLLASLAVTGWAAVTRSGSPQPRNHVEQEWMSSVPHLNKPEIKERIFKDGSEFRYLYDSQILTGMPHIHYQFSGARIRAIVNIQLGQKDIMQIEKVFVGSLHERFLSDPRTLIDISAFEPVSPQDAPFEEVLRKPVSFSYENGKVDDFEALEDDPSWSINIKRAILSQFHLSLTEREEPKDETRRDILRAGLASMDKVNEIKKMMPKKFSDSVEDSELFTVMEDGIGGRCEVSYLVMEMPFEGERLLPIDELLGETKYTPGSGSPSRTIRKPRASSTPEGDSILNITKTFDYKNCEFRPYVFQGLHMSSVCPACESNPDTFFDLLESAAHTRYNITGTKEQYLIDSAITEAVYKVTPRSHYAGSFVAYANVTMVLISSGPVRSPVSMPGQTVQIDGLHMINPTFSHREGDQVFYTSPEADKPMLQKRQYWPDVNGKPNKIKALFEKLVQGMEEREIETETADLVIYITRYLEHAFVEEIQQVHNLIKGVSVPGVQKEEIEHLFADLLVTTGTNCTFTYLKKLITEKQLTGPVVRDVLALLPFKMHVDKISPKMFEEYQEMCESEAVQSDPFTKRACALSLGTLVHKGCAHVSFDARVEWPKVKENSEKPGSSGSRRSPRQATPDSDEENLRCPTETRQQLIQKAIQYLNSAESEEQKILTIKVLGNMGLNETIDELAEIIRDDDTPLYMRTQAIYALKHVAPEISVAVAEVLLPIYRNTSNPTQIRIAAFVILLVSQPELPLIQHVAQSLNREPDLDVASYVYSSLISVANSTDPCMRNLTENVMLALEFVKPIDTDMRHSKSMHGGIYVDQMKRGLFWESNLIADKESPVPRAANFRLHSTLMDKSFDLLEFGYETEGLGDTLRKYLGNITSEHIQDVISGRASRHPRQATSDTQVPPLEQMSNMLNMEPRKPKEMRGTAYVKLFGQTSRLAVINPQTMSRLLVELITQSQSLVPQLTGPGLPMDQRRASTLMDVRVELPTVLGVPIKAGVQIPMVASIRGKLKVNMDPKPESGFAMLKMTPQRLMVESDVKTSIAAELHAKLRVFLGFLKVGTGVRSKMSFTAPISGKMEFTLKDKMTKVSMDMPDKSIKMVKMETYPVTYVMHYSATSQTFQTNRMTMAQLQPKSRSSLYEQTSEESSEVRTPRTRPAGPVSHTGEAFISLNVTEVPTEMLTKTGQVPFASFTGLPIPTMDMREIATPDFVKSRKTHLTIGKENVAAKVEIKAVCEYPDTEIPTHFLPILGSKAQMEVKLSPNPGHKKLVITVFERTEYTQKTEKELLTKLMNKMPDMTLKEVERTTPMKDLDKLYKAGHSLQVLINSEGSDAPEAWTTRGLLAVVYTTDGRYTKVVAGMNSKVPGMTKKMCLAGEMRMPDRNGMWMTTPQTPLNKSITGNLDVSWGEECGAEKFIKLRMRIQKSKEQLEIEKEDLYDINGIPVPTVVGQQVRREDRIFESLYKSCEEDRNRGAFFSRECVDFIVRYTDLLRVKFDIEYKNVSRAVRGILHKTERWMKHKYYWNTETMDVDVRNPENRLSGLIEFSADRSYVDVKYQTPHANVSLINLDLPVDVKPLSVMIPWTWPRLYGLSAPVGCTISGPKINTFDETSDDMPLSQCWHVMTKDSSDEPLFAVLVAAAGKNSLAKKVAIVFPGHRIEILPTGPLNFSPQTPPSIKNFHVKYNGQELKEVTNPDKWVSIPPNSPEEKMPLAWVHTEQPETTGNKEPIFNIVAPVAGVRVKFDGSSVTVMPSPLWKSSLIGLCGSYNGQPWDDKLLPNRTIVEGPEELSRAFLLPTSGCDAEIPETPENKPSFRTRLP